MSHPSAKTALYKYFIFTDLAKAREGNYSCIAENLFGHDQVIYTLVVLMTPGAPDVEVKYTTTRSIQLQWKVPEDGGSQLQGLLLLFIVT